jgi:hypothetical protein
MPVIQIAVFYGARILMASKLIFSGLTTLKQTIYHLSNTSSNGEAGAGKDNGDLDIKLSYPDMCETCNRLYSFRWKSDNEFFFRATFYKDDKPTGDFYGATFIRKR